jgi:hypothetical protein
MNFRRLVSLMASLFAIGGAVGQDQPNSVLNTRKVVLERQRVSLADALKSLSDQTGLNIVADDLPRRGAQEIGARGNARAALDEIGRRFDYTWKETKAGDVILYKRFEEPDEHPQISRAEALETVRALLKVLSSFSVPPAPSGMSAELRGLYEMLTPAQLQHIADGTPLFVRDLSLAQQQAVIRALIHQGFGMVPMYCEALASQLKGMEDSYVEAPQSAPAVMPMETPGNAPPPRVQQAVLTYVWRDKLRLHRAPLPHFPDVFGGNPVTPVSIGGASDGLVRISEEIRTKLNSPVTVPLGQTTLGAVAAALSTQTGVQVQAGRVLADTPADRSNRRLYGDRCTGSVV